MREQLQTLIDEYNRKKEELLKAVSTEGASCFNYIFDEFFSLNPEVEKISWTQYTPYFNDGSPCVFGVGELVVTLFGDTQADCYEGSILELNSWLQNRAKEEQWAKDLVEQYYKNVSLAGSEQRLHQIRDNVFNLEKEIHSFDEWLEIIYGDHVQIIVTKDETRVEEFDHD
jgi:hypothetical protein